jgi:endonuclease-3
MSVVPAKWKKDAHHLLILHGRYVCRARKPDCGHCVISLECEHPDKILN